jgi:integrase
MTPITAADKAFDLLDATDQVDRELGLLCCLLNYTGRRITETLDPTLADLDLKRAVLYLRETKNGDSIEVHLPPIVVQKFKDMPPRPFRDGSKGRSQEMLTCRFLSARRIGAYSASTTAATCADSSPKR